MPDSPTQLTSEDPADDSLRALARPIIATTAAWILAYSSMFAHPQLVGPVMREWGVLEATAGRIFGFENGAFFITMFLFASPLARSSRSRIAVIGGIIGLLANLASGFATDIDFFMLTRLVAGVGLGAMAAAGTASAASSANPSRVFAIASFAWATGTAIQQFTIPYPLEAYGFSGGYFLLAAICPVLIATFGWLLPPEKVPGQQATTLRSAPNRTLALYAMAALLIYEIGQSGVFTFMEQIGVNSGMEPKPIGAVFSVTRFIGLSGGALAIWVGSLAWRKWPILVGLGSNVVAVTALAYCEEETLFIALNQMWYIGYYFAIPLVMATLAKLDKLGRWAVMVDAAWNGGTFLGPVIAGMLIEYGGYGPLTLMSGATGVISLVIMAGVLKRLSDRGIC